MNRARVTAFAVFGLVLLGLLLAVAGKIAWVMSLSPDARYHALIREMRELIMAATEYHGHDLHSLEREERGRIEVGRALQTAMANSQCESPTASREKVRAIADELRRSNAEMMRTREGAYRLWARLEEACPEMREYAWMVSLREMQVEGIIPKFGELPAKK